MQDGHADRMDRVDLAVAAASPIVGLERRLEVRAVVAAGVVVLDRKVVIGEQALRDDQIVRLVAARKDRRELQPPRRRAEDRDACRDDQRLPGRRRQLETPASVDHERADRPGDLHPDDRPHPPPSGPRERIERGDRVGGKRQEGERQDRERRPWAAAAFRESPSRRRRPRARAPPSPCRAGRQEREHGQADPLLPRRDQRDTRARAGADAIEDERGQPGRRPKSQHRAGSAARQNGHGFAAGNATFGASLAEGGASKNLILLEPEQLRRDVRGELPRATCCTPARLRCTACARRRCGSRCRTARPSAG